MPWFSRRQSPVVPETPTPVPQERPSERKSAPLVTLDIARGGAGLPASFAGLSREGYRTNPVVYRCVRLLAETAASVPLRGTGSGAVASLLAGSGPLGGARPLEALYGHLAIAGSAYLEATVIGGRPVAVQAVRPDRVSVERDARGRGVGWRVSGNGRDPRGPFRSRHPPLDPHGAPPVRPARRGGRARGPLEACATAVDIHNEGARWTRSLLGNAACPSGALVYSGGPGAERLSDTQFERLRDELSRQHTGAGSAGRPLLLEGGLDWRPMSLSPSDMDFISARREAAREESRWRLACRPCCSAFRATTPTPTTARANLAFWRQTVLPLVGKTSDALSTWLSPWFEDELILSPDLDAVPALSAEREALWARLGAASFLTDSERRERAGLPPLATNQTEGGAA